ncbi:MAG TPA: VCBS repeat-containing protein, partial [Polyangiaceae bacterium]
MKDYPLESSRRGVGSDEAGSSGDGAFAGEGGEKSAGGSDGASSGNAADTDAGSGGANGAAAGSCGHVGKAAALSFLGAADYEAGTSPSAVADGDLDGDGTVDLAVANSGSNDVSILLNNGDGTFAPPAAYASGLGPDSIVVGDLDGD